MTPSPEPSGWIAVAHLLRPQGRRGELLADPLSNLPELFTAGRVFALAAPARDASPIEPMNDQHWTLESHWLPTGRNAGRLVLKFAGCDSISAAEALAGHTLLAPQSALPALEPDTWYVRDLIGCTLLDRGASVGEIIAVEYPAAPDGRTRLDAAPLLEVAPIATAEQPSAEPFLVPFLRDWLDSVDLTQKQVRMHLPQGLREPSA